MLFFQTFFVNNFLTNNARGKTYWRLLKVMVLTTYVKVKIVGGYSPFLQFYQKILLNLDKYLDKYFVLFSIELRLIHMILKQK